LKRPAVSAIQRRELTFPLGKQFHVLNVWNLLHLRPESDAVLALYRAACEATHSQAEALFAMVALVGISNAQSAMKAAALVNERIIEFGRELVEDPTNALWSATFWAP
jgi:hypothetical protein